MLASRSELSRRKSAQQSRGRALAPDRQQCRRARAARTRPADRRRRTGRRWLRGSGSPGRCRRRARWRPTGPRAARTRRHRRCRWTRGSAAPGQRRVSPARPVDQALFDLDHVDPTRPGVLAVEDRGHGVAEPEPADQHPRAAAGRRQRPSRSVAVSALSMANAPLTISSSTTRSSTSSAEHHLAAGAGMSARVSMSPRRHLQSTPDSTVGRRAVRRASVR